MSKSHKKDCTGTLTQLLCFRVCRDNQAHQESRENQEMRYSGIRHNGYIIIGCTDIICIIIVILYYSITIVSMHVDNVNVAVLQGLAGEAGAAGATGLRVRA